MDSQLFHSKTKRTGIHLEKFGCTTTSFDFPTCVFKRQANVVRNGLVRTDSKLISLIKQFRLETDTYQSEELARTTTVLSSFATYRMIQIGMVIVGVILFLIARAKKRSTLQGVGTGFIIMGPVLLVMDLLGTARADVYFEALQKLGG